FPPRPTRSDMLMRKAEERYLKGRRLYHAGEREQARQEFDAAVDILLQASENPSNRNQFERKFEEIVDAVHRFDLAGLGPGVKTDEPRFEKSPLEDILEMTFPVDPKLKNKVKEEVQATVSQLPLYVNDAVAGYINYFAGR